MRVLPVALLLALLVAAVVAQQPERTWCRHASLGCAGLRIVNLHAGRLVHSKAAHVVTYVNYDRHPAEHPKAHDVERLRLTSPFDIAVISLGSEWKGSMDKLFAFSEYTTQQAEGALLLIIDAFDVIFAPQATPDAIFAAFASFGRDLVLSTEENAYPAQSAEAAEWAASEVFGLVPRSRYPSRYLNAGGIMGRASAIGAMFIDTLRQLQTRQDAESIGDLADEVGHWFFHAYDQYELVRFLVRQNRTIASWAALDAEQRVFGSAMFLRRNRPLLASALNFTRERPASIDMEAGIEFNAPLEAFVFDGCAARYRDRVLAPLLWHGHGPEKGAYYVLMQEYSKRNCYPEHLGW